MDENRLDNQAISLRIYGRCRYRVFDGMAGGAGSEAFDTDLLQVVYKRGEETGRYSVKGHNGVVQYKDYLMDESVAFQLIPLFNGTIWDFQLNVYNARRPFNTQLMVVV